MLVFWCWTDRNNGQTMVNQHSPLILAGIRGTAFATCFWKMISSLLDLWWTWWGRLFTKRLCVHIRTYTYIAWILLDSPCFRLCQIECVPKTTRLIWTKQHMTKIPFSKPLPSYSYPNWPWILLNESMTCYTTWDRCFSTSTIAGGCPQWWMMNCCRVWVVMVRAWHFRMVGTCLFKEWILFVRHMCLRRSQYPITQQS